MRQTFMQAEQFFDLGALDDADTAAREACALLPGDPRGQRLLGLIAAARKNFTEALNLLEPVSEQFAYDPMVQTAIAEAVWATRSAAAAIPCLRRVLSIDASRHRVRGRLGLALLQAGQPEAARDELTQALAGRPRDADLMWYLGLALRELGQLGAAIDTLREAARAAPEAAYVHTALGEALLEAGDATAAMSALAEAARRDRTSHLTWMLLGRAAGLAGAASRAVECFRQALATVPAAHDAVPARTALANALHAEGRIEEARIEFARLMHRLGGRARAAAPRTLRVGVLAAPGSANTPTEFLIDRTLFAVEPVFVIDGLDVPIRCLSAGFDLLFNAISDPDEAGAALRTAGKWCCHVGRRVVNPPAAIWATTREAMATRLSGLADAIMPNTRRSRRADVVNGRRPDLRFPLLLRPMGSHGGAGIVRVADLPALRAAAAAVPGDEVYLTEYHDCQSSDGFWRKYRTVFIGGTVFPYHLSIGKDWLNHYFRTETNRDPLLQAEETAFLRDPVAALGERASRALGAIAARIDLDYFGLDFALGDDGRLIVFECNAAMRVRGVREPGSAKAQAAERIRDAMTQMLTAS